MRNLPLVGLLLVALVATVGPASVAADATQQTMFTTTLSGAEERPANNSPATGRAVFRLSADGTQLSYTLTVADIDNVVEAHLHLAPPGINGPIVPTLFGPVPPGGGRVDGMLAEGTLTPADLMGPFEGSQSLAALLEVMREGKTYVNVHTDDGVPPPFTGPGDLPTGEIRGQLAVATGL